MAATLTVANSAIAMTTEALFPSAVNLQGYSADDAFESDTVENGEFSMGIDGQLSAGFVFNATQLTLTFQADSPSLDLFEQIYLYEQANRTKLQQEITISLPSKGRRYDYQQGYMVSYKAPAGKKILQPGVVVFTFKRLQPSPL